MSIQPQQTTGGAHIVPVVLIGSATSEADLIVLTVAAESWPSKTMRATSSENPLQKAHLLHSSVRESIERIVPFHLRDGSRDSSLGQGRCVQRRTSVLERAKACLLKWRQSDFTIVLTSFQITNVQSGVNARCHRRGSNPLGFNVSRLLGKQAVARIRWW